MDRAGTSPGFKKIFANILDSSADDGDGSDKESPQNVKTQQSKPSVATEESTPSRRLRDGKFPTGGDLSTEKKSLKKGRGKKRSLSGKEDETPVAKRYEKEVATTPVLKTPTKVVAQASAIAAVTKSPIGVNRRNAVLFTRKKQAAAVSTPEPREEDSDGTIDDLENKETEVQSPGIFCFLFSFLHSTRVFAKVLFYLPMTFLKLLILSGTCTFLYAVH